MAKFIVKFRFERYKLNLNFQSYLNSIFHTLKGFIGQIKSNYFFIKSKVEMQEFFYSKYLLYGKRKVVANFCNRKR